MPEEQPIADNEKTVSLDTPTVTSGAGFGGALELPAGRIIAERYRVVEELGRGGMGVVYRVEQIALGRDMALKTIDGHEIKDATWRRFQQEAKASSLLDHPNLISVHDSGMIDGRHPYFVMDLVQGTTLAKLVEEKGPLSVEEALPIFIQVCFGLAYAHDLGIVHRDLKPSNIMLTKNVHGEERAKILDFGVAKVIRQDAAKDSALTQTGEIFGSPLYMSPEQCQGTPVEHSSDIYSLGCVMYECLTGSPPIRGATIYDTIRRQVSEMPLRFQQVRPKLGGLDRLEAIVFKCLAKDPEKRYSTMSDLRKDLIALRGGATTDWKVVAQAAHSLLLLDLKLLFSKSGPGTVALMVISMTALLVAIVSLGAWLMAPLETPAFEAPEKLWQVNFKPDIQESDVKGKKADAIEQLNQMNQLMMFHGKSRQQLQRDYLEFGDRCFAAGAIDYAKGYYKQAAEHIFPGDHFLSMTETIRCFVRTADLQFFKGEYKGALNAYERAIPLLDQWSELSPANLTPVYTRAARSASLIAANDKQLEKGLAVANLAVQLVQKDAKLERALAMTVAADLNRQLAVGYCGSQTTSSIVETRSQRTAMLSDAARMYGELADATFVSDRPQRDFVVARFCHGLVHEKLGDWKVAAEDFAQVYPNLLSEFGAGNPITKACLVKEADAQWKAGDKLEAIWLRLSAKLK